MADHGNPTPKDTLTLNPGADFTRTYRMEGGDFPEGFELFYWIHLPDETLEWQFSISGDTASLKVESEVADTVPERTEWQLMYREDSNPTFEDEICWGVVKRSHKGGIG